MSVPAGWFLLHRPAYRLEVSTGCNRPSDGRHPRLLAWAGCGCPGKDVDGGVDVGMADMPTCGASELGLVLARALVDDTTVVAGLRRVRRPNPNQPAAGT